MCAHYDPVITTSKLQTHFGVGEVSLGLKDSLWPGYMGPLLRKHEFADVGDEAVPIKK